MQMVLASADGATDLAKFANMIVVVAIPTVAAISDSDSSSEVKQLCAEGTRLADLIASLTHVTPIFSMTMPISVKVYISIL